MTPTDPVWLDSMYNNRALVPDHAIYFSRWDEASAQVRDLAPCMLDVEYGKSGGEKLDVFPAADAEAPIVFFIHGGYWRSLDKADHSFIAPSFTEQGACVVIPNYDLCPAVTIPQIIEQMVNALVWIYHNAARYGGNAQRITVIGHSAGGHLAAMLMTYDWKAHAADLPADLVKNALSISGLYDLEPLMNTPFLKDSLLLTPEQVHQASPVEFLPPKGGVLYTVAGSLESEEFLRQNLLIQQTWGSDSVPVCEALPGLNHFSVVEALIEPGHRLKQLALKLIASA